MITQKKKPKRIFWIMLAVIFLLTGGHISASSAGVLPSDLIITEFMAANKTGLVDEDGDHSDWIEIYNRSDLPVNLAGWALTNDPNQPQQWPFPDITLGSKEYLVVFASGKNRRDVGEHGAILHTNFKLSKKGDFLALHNLLEGRLMDTVSSQFPEQFGDVSYGRYDESLSFGYLANPTPGQPNDKTLFWVGAVAPVEFSMKRGFYEAPFTVVLVTTPGATIYYTLDGSEPTESNGMVFSGEPITIQGTTMLRAVAFKPNFLPSEVTTHTYIFPDDVVTQLGVSSELMASASTHSHDSQHDYEVVPAAVGVEANPGLTDDSPTRNELVQSLKSIPTISLVMAGQSLTDLNAEPQAIEKRTEYPVSVELIDSAGTQQGFQINAGVKLQNVPAPSESIAKRSLRLFFRGDYGATRLEYPLFTDSTVESFDTLLLEAGSNINLAGQDQANFIRNEWLRASQLEMSDLGAHGMFVHLYLNGKYWGLYNVAERPDADFMASYLGGMKEDWFIANQDGPVTNDLDPQADKLNDLFKVLPLLSRLDLGNSAVGQSNDVDGVYAAAASHFDATNLIDLAILNWYTGWPIDNWYAAVRVQDQMGRGKILIADEQQAIVNSTEQTHQSVINQLVHASMQNPEFQVQFADRLYKHLYNNGALADANGHARWMRFNDIIEPAFTAESVRWQGSNEVAVPTIGGPLKMQHDDVVAHLANRVDDVVEMMRKMGYYPFIDPPVFNQEGGMVESGFMLIMSSQCSDCTIYYTTDGSDPRLPFTGEVIPTAKAYNAPIEMDATTVIKARVFDASMSADEQQWSALHETTFNVVKEDNKLRLTEIMYNPPAGDDYEFVELQNTGNSLVELANISLDDGIRFTFLPNAPALAPGEFAVLVSNPETFAEQYPDVAISGVYDGHLSNKGERILLRDASGEVMIEITYNDEYGWPVSADGRGDSLTLINTDGNPGDPKNWRASDRLNGSPGE